MSTSKPDQLVRSLSDLRGEVPDAEVHEFHSRHTRFCVCIPIINEGDSIRHQLKSMQPFIRIADLIIADGGSSDGSTDPNFLRDLNVRTLLVKTGGGRLSAQLRMGFAYALQQGYEGIVTVDGNNKDDVTAIPEFLRQLQRGVDFVQGSRYLPGGKAINVPWIREYAIKKIHAPLVSLAAGFRFTDTTNGFRGYSRKFLLDPRVKPFRDVFQDYELLWYLSAKAPRIGAKVTEIPVTRCYPSGEVPTKIRGMRGNLRILLELLRLLRGGYDPPKIDKEC